MQEFLAPIRFFYLSEFGAPLLLLFKDTAGLSGRLCGCPLHFLTSGDLCRGAQPHPHGIHLVAAQSLIKSPGITHTRRSWQILGHSLCKHTQTAKQRNSMQLETSGSCEGKDWCPQCVGNVHTMHTDGVGGINTPAFGHFLHDY